MIRVNAREDDEQNAGYDPESLFNQRLCDVQHRMLASFAGALEDLGTAVVEQRKCMPFVHRLWLFVDPFLKKDRVLYQTRGSQACGGTVGETTHQT